MQWLTALFTNPDSIAHIILAYSIVVALGLALGRIRVFGVSLGVTFVLFAGLALNYFGLKVNPTVLGFIRDFGLILFVFFIGLQVGPSFFSSFKSGGVVLNCLMILAVVLSVAVTIVLYFLFDDTISLAQMLGVHFGAVTNTPGLGATQEALAQLNYHGEDIAVGYACAYPLGVVSIIGTAIALRLMFRIDLKEEDKHWEAEEKTTNHVSIFFHVIVANRALEGRTIGSIRDFIGRPFICSRILHNGEITSPSADSLVHVGDTIRIVSAEENKDPIVAFFGEEDTKIDLATEHSPITSRRLVVTRQAINGLTISDLHLSHSDGVNITRVYRAGMQLFPYRNLHIQMGDELYCVGPENSVKRLAERLGNQVKRLEHPNLVTIFLGIAIGILFGSLPLAIPGMPVPLKLGLAGGPLIVAILLGRYGSLFRLITYTTSSANLMMREIGIALFLASVGLAAGENFVAALLVGNGWLYVGLGLFVTIIPLLIVGIIARKFFHINYHSIVGLLAGATTDPPMLAYAATLSEKNSSAVAYSTVYPLAMFLRILTGQVILLAMWSFVTV
ncbi:MAG TPA: putative transporter [Candidatus Aphodousia faecipullorum]|nr:putative transporter [Candidatus Aphodousia faecipullorum]